MTETRTTAAAPKVRRRAVECYETAAVSPLPPGWRNLYRVDNGKTRTTPCPAILLQELRETDHCTDTPTPGGGYVVSTRKVRHDPPFETRAVFADLDGFGGLDAASDTDNYETTIGPGDPDPGHDGCDLDGVDL